MIKSQLFEELMAFRQQRDWEQFHSPKDLAISISIEAAELLEWFQWKNDEKIAQDLTSKKKEQLEDEIADVAIYLSYLCGDLDIDINQIVAKKIKKNAIKYPIAKVKGRSDKYDQY